VGAGPAGQWLLRTAAGLLAGAVPAPLRPLAVLGRWSLSFYMLHQPVFIGVHAGGRKLGWW
jgi:peptidoglycan/LPS O-acetylase OafA/YrhL